ncbi:MAG TPA: hypothetical protein VMS75_03335 [Terriglobales bacterium]|nr:hypothetical protein [Terriglobales bacterium]
MLRRMSTDHPPVRTHAEQRGFKLSLPLVVEGPDAEGAFFREETTLAYMSHVGALFPLKTPVSPGSRLKLAVALPPKLDEGKNLKLVIKGTIVFTEPGADDASPAQVSIRLESRYIVESAPPAGVTAPEPGL